MANHVSSFEFLLFLSQSQPDWYGLNVSVRPVYGDDLLLSVRVSRGEPLRLGEVMGVELPDGISALIMGWWDQSVLTCKLALSLSLSLFSPPPPPFVRT